MARGFDVIAYDVDPDQTCGRGRAAARKPASGLSEMAQKADIFVACLRTDDQMEAVAEELVAHGRPGQLIVVAGTHSLEFMQRLAGIVKREDIAAHRCARRLRRTGRTGGNAALAVWR